MFLELEGINTIIRAAHYDTEIIKGVIQSKFDYSSFKNYWYGRNGRPGIKMMIPKLLAQDNNQLPGTLNPVMKSIINQLEYDYAI
jgi:hypothetical protein